VWSENTWLVRVVALYISMYIASAWAQAHRLSPPLIPIWAYAAATTALILGTLAYCWPSRNKSGWDE
jgi:hypothetical protein